MSRTFVRRVAYLFFGLFLSINVIQFTQFPIFNWDAIAYTYIAYQDRYPEIEERHAQTYESMRERMIPSRYAYITGRTDYRNAPYRRDVADSAQLLDDQIDFYTFKIGLPTLMRIGANLGMDPLDVGRAINIASYAGFSILFFLLALRGTAPLQTSAIASFLIALIPFKWNATAITPDALSAFLVLLCAYLFHVKGLRYWPAAILAIAVLVRPDNVLLAVCIYTAALIMRVVSIKTFLMLLTPPIIVYAAMAYSIDYYGWTKHFYVTFIDRPADIADLIPQISISDYINIYPQIMAVASYTSLFAGVGALLIMTVAQKCENTTLRNAFVFGGVFFLFAYLAARFLCYGGDFSQSYYAGNLDYETSWFALTAGLLVVCAFLVTAVLFAPKWSGYAHKTFSDALLPGAAVYMCSHFMLFPADKNRMLTGAFLYIIAQAWVMFGPKLKQGLSKPKASPSAIKQAAAE